MPMQAFPGTISINGLPIAVPQSFATHAEILDLFGIKYSRHYEAYHQLPGDVLIWFPRIRSSAHGLRYAVRGDFIEEDYSTSSTGPSLRDLLLRNHQRITFVQERGRYYFAGVYVYDRAQGNNVQVYRKVAGSVRLESRIL